MIPITPGAVGACQPVLDGYDNWQIDITWDDLFDHPSYKDGIPHPSDEEYVWYKAFFKGDERWTAGINVWTDGSDRWYQSFIFQGDPPRQGLKHPPSSGKSREAGPAFRITSTGIQDSELRLEKYPWFRCTVKPLHMKFDQEIITSISQLKTPDFQPAVAIYDTIVNAKDAPSTYSVTVSQSFESTLSVTDTKGWHVNAGVEIESSTQVNVPATASKKFTATMKFDVGLNGSIVRTEADKDVTSISRTITEVLEPWSALQISVVSDVVKGLPGTLDLTVRLSGSVNGQVMDGRFLIDMVNATPNMTLVRMNAENSAMTYVTTAEMTADVLSNADVVIYEIPMPDVSGVEGDAIASETPDVLTLSDMRKISRKELASMKSGKAPAL